MLRLTPLAYHVTRIQKRTEERKQETTMPDNERFILVIETASGYRLPLIARLRSFLKIALRQFGLRVVELRPTSPATPEVLP